MSQFPELQSTPPPTSPEEILPLRAAPQLWSVPPQMASSVQGNVCFRAVLSSSGALSELKQAETAGVTLASYMAAGAKSSLWAHEQCVCPFNIVFAVNEAIGNIYGALLGSCSVSSWLKPSPCVQLA